MQRLLSAHEMHGADGYTHTEIGVDALILMERAAAAVVDHMMAAVTMPENGRPLRAAVICGKGNNGADAMAVGRMLMDRGVQVTIYTINLEETYALSVQHRIIKQYARHYEFRYLTFDHRKFDDPGDRSAYDALRADHADIYVDGIFGTGLTREVQGTEREVVDLVNEMAARDHAYVVAVDIPSGIHTDDGSVLGTAIRATQTVTFGFYKRGQFLYPGATYCGQLTLADIGIPQWSYDCARLDPEYIDTDAGTTWFTYTYETPDDLLPERNPSGNKGTFGKGLIVAGSYAMAGAATMAASAAGRMGCGMVKVFTREENRVIIQDTVPEALLSLWSPDDSHAAILRLAEDLQWADTVAIGPALGKSDTEAMLVMTVLEHAGDHVQHVILDADAIRLIAERDLYEFLAEAGKRADVILTPHLAECAALLGTTVRELQVDRERTIKAFADAYHVTILCKDARSMVVSARDDRTYLNTSGNDGLATAGSGDVLTGILTACTAQGLSGLDAAAAAAHLHGRLAELAEGETGKRGLVAPDLYRRLSGVASVVWSQEWAEDPAS